MGNSIIRTEQSSRGSDLAPIAEASGLGEEAVRNIVKNNTNGKVLGIFGEETVNVLMVNIEIAQNMGLI